MLIDAKPDALVLENDLVATSSRRNRRTNGSVLIRDRLRTSNGGTCQRHCVIRGRSGELHLVCADDPDQ